MRTIVTLLALLLLMISCSDTIQETIFDKDLEAGRFDASKFDRAKFK